MVNDPGGQRGYRTGVTKKQAVEQREKLFDIIKELVKWENTNNEEVLERARIAIRQSWRETCEMNKGKPVFDPANSPLSMIPSQAAEPFRWKLSGSDWKVMPAI